MATFYWVGDSGVWRDASHWSYTSGGPGGAGIPGDFDDCIFDSWSGYQTDITLPSSSETYWANFRSLNTTNFGHGLGQRLTFGVDVGTDQRMNCWGNSPNPTTPIVNLGPATDFHKSTVLNFNGGGVAALSGQVGYGLIYIVYGTTLYLLNSLYFPEAYGGISVFNGSFITNGHNITGNRLSRLLFRAANVGEVANANFTGTALVDVGDVSVYYPERTTLVCPTEFRIHRMLAGGGPSSLLAVNKVTFVDDGIVVQDRPLLAGAWNITNLDITNTAALYFNNPFTSLEPTVTNLITTNAAPLKRLDKASFVTDSQWVMKKSNATPVTLDYLDIRNSSALPFTPPSTYTWNAGVNSVNGGNNTGWKFLQQECQFNVTGVSPLSSLAGTYTVASVAVSNSPCEGGAWTASLLPSTPAWITSLSPLSGTGSTPLTYITANLAANTDPANSRSGIVRINGVDVTITQSAATLPTCVFNVAGPVILGPEAGNTILLPVGHSPEFCAGGSWSIPLSYLEASAGWLSVGPTSGGTSTPFITFTTTSVNSSQSPRATTLRLLDASGFYTDFAVIQEGTPPPTCVTFQSTTPGPLTYTAAETPFTLTVLGSPAGCIAGEFVITTDVAWITLDSYTHIGGDVVYPLIGAPPYTIENGAVVIGTVEQNVGLSSRQGTITISAGGSSQVITVTQAGSTPPDPCTSWSTPQTGPYTVSASASTLGTQITVGVVGDPVGCTGNSWTTSKDVTWLAISSTAENSFFINWSANDTGAQRVGHVTLHGNPDQVITITQEAAVIVPVYCNQLTVSGGGTFTVSSPASTPSTRRSLTLIGQSPTCEFVNLSVVSSHAWLTLSQIDVKNYFVDWTVNDTGSTRTGTITVSFTDPDTNLPATEVVLTITQNSAVVIALPPNPPTNVLATLNPNNTATITWDNGGQLGLTNTQLQVVVNGVIGSSTLIGVVSSYATATLLPNTVYNFRIALINAEGTSAAVTSNSVYITTTITASIVDPPREVVATFDEPTQTILVEWDLNGQSNLFSYSTIGFDPSIPNSVEVVPVATSFRITDLTNFDSGSSYIFKVALTRFVGGRKYTSTFTSSNALEIIKPTIPRNIYNVSFFNTFYADYQTVSRPPVPISSLVTRRTSESSLTPSNYYSTNGIFSSVSYVPVTKSFTDHVFTVTNSYSDTLTASTTWNYENRVGLVFFELPEDTSIGTNGITLYFKIAPEIYNTIYNSNSVTLNYYTVDPAYVTEDLDGNLMVDKKAYLITRASEKVSSSSSLTDLKLAGSNYVKKTISPSAVMRFAQNSRRIVAIRFAISLAESAAIPTGFNYVPILVNSMQLGVEESVIPHPENFRLLPTADDILLRWEKPDFDRVYGYKVELQEELDQPGTFGIQRNGVYEEGEWASIIIVDSSSTTLEFSIKNGIVDSSPYQEWDETKRYSARVTTLVGNQNFEYSIPTYNLWGGIGTASIPDPPTTVRIFSGDNKFFLSWNGPLNNVESPVHRFAITLFDVDNSVPVTATPLSVHKYEGVTAYETYGLEVDSSIADIYNGRRYSASIVATNAVGSSSAAVSGIVTVSPAYRLTTVDNRKYKKFYEYPVELIDPETFGQPLYDSSVIEYGDAYLTSRVTYPVSIGNSNNILHLFVSEYGFEEEAHITIPSGTYSDAISLSEAVKQGIVNGWTDVLGPIPVYTMNVTADSFTLYHPGGSDPAQLHLISGVASANEAIFGGESLNVSPNKVVHVERHVPTVEYDIKNKKCLSDLKPYVPIEERFEITPATRSIRTKSDYPLSFTLKYKDIRAGSLSIEWYVQGVKEIITDTGNGFIISPEKIDACGNKISSQQLGFVDYAAGIVSCNLPEITSGYAIIKYAANLPVMNKQQYIWSPTPHFGLNLILREPVYFGATQWAYINQNSARLRPGYTVLEYINATIQLRSLLVNVEDTVDVSIE